MIEVRKMRADDMAAAVALLDRWNMAPRPPSNDEPDPERTRLIVEHSFVAECEGAIVGVASYILCGVDRAETASLAVDPAVRGMGVGTRLQHSRIDEMRARGIRSVRTEADRPETVRWYVEHFGYRIAGTNLKKHSFGLPDVDTWTVLELDITI